MLGSNQRPLPCEGRSITSWLFAGVQKYLQNRTFASTDIRTRSQLFVWVGVLIGVIRGVPTFESISTTLRLTATLS
jgi:hypothetical protein